MSSGSTLAKRFHLPLQLFNLRHELFPLQAALVQLPDDVLRVSQCMHIVDLVTHAAGKAVDLVGAGITLAEDIFTAGPPKPVMSTPLSEGANRTSGHVLRFLAEAGGGTLG
jgi:hypothetical protein